MLGLEDFMTIQALVKRGVYLCDIAAQLGVHRKTVSRAVTRGGPPAPRRGRRGSLLDPFRPVIDGLVAEGVWNAVVIWRELQARGYGGCVSLIRDYLHPKRPLRPGDGALRDRARPAAADGLGGAPDGDRGAARRGALRGEHPQLFAALPLLGDGLRGRRAYLRGAGPGLRMVRRRAGRGPGRQSEGGRHRPSAARRGPVPSPLPRSGRALRLPPAGLPPSPGPDQGQGRAQRRLRQAPLLRPLPRLRELGSSQPARRAVAAGGSRPPGARHRARSRGRALRPRGADPAAPAPAYVEVRGNRYSVPSALAGRPVRVRITLDGVVAVYDGEQCVAQHTLRPAAQGWVTVPDHHAELWADTLAVERRPLAVYEEVATWN